MAPSQDASDHQDYYIFNRETPFNLDLPLLLGGATPKPLVELISGFAGIEILTRETWRLVKLQNLRVFNNQCLESTTKINQFQIVCLVKQPTFFQVNLWKHLYNPGTPFPTIFFSRMFGEFQPFSCKDLVHHHPIDSQPF